MADLRKELEEIAAKRGYTTFLEAAGLPRCVDRLASDMFVYGNFTDREANCVREGYRRFNEVGYIKDGEQWEPSPFAAGERE